MSGYPYLDDLARQARDRPDGLALVLPHRRVTWRELGLEATRYAQRHAAGHPGDDPAVELPLAPGEEAVVALHALPRIGRYLVPVDPASGGPPEARGSVRARPARVAPSIAASAGEMPCRCRRSG